MVKNIIVMPAHGRDYTSASAARASWQAGEDFLLYDTIPNGGGKLINKGRIAETDFEVYIRYGKLRRICQL